MPFERPQILEIKRRIEADLDSRVLSGDPRLRRELIRVLGQMEAGVAHGLYGSIDWLANNLLPNTQDESILGIWAAVYRVPRLDPTTASGPVIFTGTDGATVPAGTVLQSGTGVQYTLQADAVVAAGIAQGAVDAQITGTDGNQVEGALLSLLAPIANINSEVTVGTGGLVGGAALESVSAWSDRMLQRIQKPPVGGARHDYERWAREAHPSVTHAWINAHEGGRRGVVVVRIATYGDAAGDLPAANSPLLNTVYQYIDERRPVAGGLDVFAPVPQPVNMTLAIKPDTVAVRAAAETALEELFRREARPGAYQAGQGQLLGTIPLTHVGEALSLVTDEEDHQIQAIDSLAPATAGHMLVLGDITWGAWQS